MAGAGYKLFNTGDVLTAAQVNTYLQEQAVMRFANATARTTALSGVLAEGMMSYLDDTNSVEVYNGSAWVSVGSTGDITGITAGTGISGGGTSGDVTITNSMATAIDAKGDLVVGTGADTFSRLAVGSNNQVLTADSTTATGLKWASAGSSFSGVSVTRTSNQSIPNNTTTKIAFDSENYDTDSFHDNSTNNTRLTIPSGKGGKYTVNYIFSFNGFNGNINIGFYKNNAFYALTDVFNTANTTNYWTSGAFTLNLNAGDYMEMTFYQNSGGNLDVRGTDTQVQMTYLGA